MKKITSKSLILFAFTLFSFVLSGQTVAPDEDTGTYTTCNDDGANATRTSNDLPSAANVGTIDDRSCYANYKESNVYGKTWGIYNITHNSNNQDAANTLQPRIERSLSRSQATGVGSYARFTGTVRILEVGVTSSDGSDGTYIMQAKGKHTGEGGSNDPAICLFLAKAVYGQDTNGNPVQVSFNIFREQINYRGGSGAAGRDIVFLTNIGKNVETDIELEVGFREDPSDATKKIHYADAVIGSETFNFTIPEPERGVESGIRYGAYRVKGGRAQIRWANTTYTKEEVENSGDLPVGICRLKNVATGKYLRSSGSSIVASDSGEGSDKEWQFVKAEVSGFNYYNIDSEVKGIIRFKGGSSAPELVSTSFGAPNQAVDKIWTIIDNGDGTYSFETKNNKRYLYHAEDNTMIHSSNTDDRSKWILESTTLSINDKDLETPTVKIYPNPAKDSFTLAFENQNTVKVEIYDITGKIVYQNSTNKGVLEVEVSHKFTSGLYLVKTLAENNKVYHTKLVIK
ncbi:T9SS type A sorting domain-containing protein [Algibacter pacificus]|uniref:T9SS type A sorting domain-containing protein n=1 Tax=Algibacter pacificus TaxID=2599389 RepID=UPI0011CC8B84|nr:T9SS type A sorting domain-containing protein [Algibacter pacificus]